jgi:hypothetical protein
VIFIVWAVYKAIRELQDGWPCPDPGDPQAGRREAQRDDVRRRRAGDVREFPAGEGVIPVDPAQLVREIRWELASDRPAPEDGG